MLGLRTQPSLRRRVPMNIAPHQLTDLGELRRRIHTEANAKQRDRWRALLLALEGQTTTVIMDKLGRSKNFVQRWAYFYRDHGLERVRPTWLRRQFVRRAKVAKIDCSRSNCCGENLRETRERL